MEPPSSSSASSLHEAKSEVVRHLSPLSPFNTVVGQYTRSEDGKLGGYREDPTVDPHSTAHTLISCVLKIENNRWRGVPWVIVCGKAMDRKVNQIRITFKTRENSKTWMESLFPSNPNPTNQLVIDVTPTPTIEFCMNIKQPGLSDDVLPTKLELTESTKKELSDSPDAYERLIFDAVRGKKSLFVDQDETIAAWNVVTDYLHQIEHKKQKPFEYPAGTKLPDEIKQLWEKLEIKLKAEEL